MPPSLQPQSDATLNPIHTYDRAIADEKLREDPAQRFIIQRLQQLYEQLAMVPKKAFWSMGGWKKSPLRSVYIWGEVGRGKSMLMDMFYHASPAVKSQRIHFHAFMTNVHASIHAFRQQHKDENPVESVAKQIAQETQLLCLDEFQVTDVADAMILSKLFATMLEQKTVFVMTSNRPPQELYRGGLQREKFMEFVTLVNDHMDILPLESPTDYRMQQIRALQTVYLCPDNASSNAGLDSIFSMLTHHRPPSAATLVAQGREWIVRETYGGIARFTFAELCEAPLGKADYLEIAKHFHTVLIQHIPQLGAEKRNESRRFVTLIDVFYDQKVKLICTAQVPPEELYTQGDGVFEFHRTVSRLVEMQSAAYLEAAHRK